MVDVAVAVAFTVLLLECLFVKVAVASSAASTDILDAYAVALRSLMFLYYLIATCFYILST